MRKLAIISLLPFDHSTAFFCSSWILFSLWISSASYVISDVGKKYMLKYFTATPLRNSTTATWIGS